MHSDRTLLCLACSSSILPRRTSSPLSPNLNSSLDRSSSTSKLFDPADADDLYYTPCCRRPICTSCLASNPRLARYNPCLHCLGGVAVVNARSASSPGQLQAPFEQQRSTSPQNIDGGVHDADVFIVGDEDEDDQEPEFDDDKGTSTATSSSDTSSEPSTPPPPYAETVTEQAGQPPSVLDAAEDAQENSIVVGDGKAEMPTKYYIKSDDTLLGISLKYGVDGHALCRLNNLPTSTLRTTPHLLHTRSFLTLPPSSRKVNAEIPKLSPEEEAARETRRARERAEKRLQLLTRETDSRVARTYVALAESSTPPEVEEPQGEFKKQEKLKPENVLVRDPYTGVESSLPMSLEARAIDRYLDDDEWEERERQAGRPVAIPKFPLSGSMSGKTGKKSWWKLK